MYRTLMLLCFSALLTAPVFAGGIHKWVDENGKTHFGDRPPADARQSQEVKIKDIPQAERQAPNAAERNARRQYLLRSYEIERAGKKKAAAEAKKKHQELTAQCVRARHSLQQLKKASHLYNLDESGNKVIRSDQERDNATRTLEKAIKKNCG